MWNYKWRFSFPLSDHTSDKTSWFCQLLTENGSNTFLQKIQSHRSTCLFGACSIYSICIYSKKTDHIQPISLVGSIFSTLLLKILSMLLKVGIQWAREYKKSLGYHTVGKLSKPRGPLNWGSYAELEFDALEIVWFAWYILRICTNFGLQMEYSSEFPPDHPT